MQTTNRDLMKQAREALKGRWGLAVGGNAIYMILGLLIGGIPRVGWIGSLIIGGPLLLGCVTFFLFLSRKQDAQLSQLFEGFQNFTRALVAYLLMILFVLLWAILLIIPGIVAALAYSQTFFILSENPKMESSDALRKSKAMMKGNRWKLFCLFWRFFGWFLLGIVSLIGFLWIIPYLQTSLARFYDDLKAGDGPPVVEEVVSQPAQS
ncbi:MAG: DUF975 family protein [Thermoguttaceae bacterium]|jgi:uncharacterized membrane protein